MQEWTDRPNEGEECRSWHAWSVWNPPVETLGGNVLGHFTRPADKKDVYKGYVSYSITKLSWAENQVTSSGSVQKCLGTPRLAKLADIFLVSPRLNIQPFTLHIGCFTRLFISSLLYSSMTFTSVWVAI